MSYGAAEPEHLGSMQVPVDLWYGGHDTSTVHSPDLGVTLAGRIPPTRRYFLADAGGSLLWTHAEPILTSVLQRGRHGCRRPYGCQIANSRRDN